MSSIFAHEPAAAKRVPIRSVVGIVDKLPGPITSSTSPSGCEGIAYLLAPAEDHDTEPTVRPQDDSSTSLLRFWLRPGEIHHNSKRSRIRAFVKGRANVSVPLANTIFINGRNTTLIETSWDRSESGSLVPGLSSPISILNIPLQRPTGTSVRESIPLMRVTPPRIARSAMGNILREVEIDKEPVPASKELEAAVMQSPFPSHPDGRRPQVFAQVMPPWVSRFSNPVFTNALWAGFGLYRVTGGGGGWGQKQGLLSLDPVQTYSPTGADPSALDIMVSSDDDVANVLRRDADLVSPGDTVVFLRESTEADTGPHARWSNLGHMHWGSEDLKQRMLIGVLPPQNDGPTPATDSAVTATSPATHMRNAFGLLSERGFALEFCGERMAKEDGNGTGQTESGPTEPRVVHSQCKVEVPNSWLGTEVEMSHWEQHRRIAEKKARREVHQSHLRQKLVRRAEEKAEEHQQARSSTGRDILITTKVPTADPSLEPGRTDLEQQDEVERVRIRRHEARPAIRKYKVAPGFRKTPTRDVFREIDPRFRMVWN